MKKLLLFCCALFVAGLSLAQQTFPVNGPWDVRPGQYAFTNATIVVNADQTIANGTLLIKDRVIEGVSADMKVPKGRKAPVYELLALVNEKLWLGHFDVASDDNSPAFRHAVLLRGALGASVEQIEDLVDIALSECERFYPAFQLVVWGGKTADEAITAAMIDPVGEA